MTETLPTSKVADFNDVLAGFEKFGSIGPDNPVDLEELKHYCEALAFTVSGDLMDIRNLLWGRDLAMCADANFSEAESLGYALKNAGTRICALTELGSRAADHIKELKTQQEGAS